MEAPLSRAVREAGARIVAALAARFRDLDLAEEGFAEACAQAAEAWPNRGIPVNPHGWLYRAAERRAVDAARKRRVRERLTSEELEPDLEALMMDEPVLIPDERLRLIFVCCHPAVARESRAALTLRLVCGLSTAEIARAFLLSETALAQRLVRAKRKIAEAGVPFEIPGPGLWPARLDAVLSTLEVAYSKAHEDAAGAGAHAGFAAEMLELSRLVAELLPDEPDALAFAALVRYAEARRPARTDWNGVMVPLSDQNPALWDRSLIDQADTYLGKAGTRGPLCPRVIQAAIHGVWCARRNLSQPAPWREVLKLYDLLVTASDSPIVRLNRAVALAEVNGVHAGLEALEALDQNALAGFLPYQAARADLLRRAGRGAEAASAYDAALALGPTPAEELWLAARQASIAG